MLLPFDFFPLYPWPLLLNLENFFQAVFEVLSDGEGCFAIDGC